MSSEVRWGEPDLVYLKHGPYILYSIANTRLVRVSLCRTRVPSSHSCSNIACARSPSDELARGATDARSFRGRGGTLIGRVRGGESERHATPCGRRTRVVVIESGCVASLWEDCGPAPSPFDATRRKSRVSRDPRRSRFDLGFGYKS